MYNKIHSLLFVKRQINHGNSEQRPQAHCGGIVVKTVQNFPTKKGKLYVYIETSCDMYDIACYMEVGVARRIRTINNGHFYCPI